MNTPNQPVAIGVRVDPYTAVAIGRPSPEGPVEFDVDPLSLALADAALKCRETRHPIRKWIDRTFR